MPLPNDPKAYRDCYDLLDRAMASEYGIQRICDSEYDALELRRRIHMARSINRELNKRAFKEDHALANSSEYAIITVRVVEDEERGIWLCQLRKNAFRESEIEELGPEVEQSKERHFVVGALHEIHEPKEKDFDLDDSEGDLGDGQGRPNRDRNF